jgi:DNA polymerase III delta prime subunit
MKINIKNIIEKITKKDNSTSILIVHRDFEKQEKFVEEFTRAILDIPKTKPYKTHSDLFGIWPENIERKNIKIEQIHEFIRKTQLKPFLSKFKVGVIFSAEKMTEESQNALLKTLEEPPQNTFLILTSTNKDKLIPTVLSRCQILEFFSKSGRSTKI